MFKDLRTSTKLFLLCGMFVGAIILATYSLIKEKQIAIGFVRKELVGAQYLEALRGVYAVILAESADASQASQRQASAIVALDTLAKAEAETGGSLHTAALAENLATTVRDLVAAGTGDDKSPLAAEALAGARDLAARIGDESNLALDPDLDSYYIQNIVVKRVPALLSQMGELQSLLTGSPSDDDSHVRPLPPRRNDQIEHRGDQTGRRGSLPPRYRCPTEADAQRQWLAEILNRKIQANLSARNMDMGSLR